MIDVQDLEFLSAWCMHAATSTRLARENELAGMVWQYDTSERDRLAAKLDVVNTDYDNAQHLIGNLRSRNLAEAILSALDSLD